MLKKIFPFVLGFVIIFTPSFMFAEAVSFSGLVPVCNTTLDPVTHGYKDPCDFNMIMALVNKVINFLLFVIATPLFALILVYVGWLYISSMGNPENITKTKTILKNALLGFVIALAAWLIIKTILLSLGFTGDSYLGTSLLINTLSVFV